MGTLVAFPDSSPGVLSPHALGVKFTFPSSHLAIFRPPELLQTSFFLLFLLSLFVIIFFEEF